MSYLTRLLVRKNSGSNTGQRGRLNFIEGSGIALTIADDSTDEEIDITVATSGLASSFPTDSGTATPSSGAVSILGGSNGIDTTASGSTITINFDPTETFSAPIPISNGGTGQVTALAAFNALSPLTTRGDLLTRDASNNIRLAIGSAGKFLRTDGTDASWQTIAETDVISAVTTKTADYTATTADSTILVDATSGNVVITLYTAVGNTGRNLYIKKIDSSTNTVTLDANGTQTIDGALTQVTKFQYESFMIQSDGANWNIL